MGFYTRQQLALLLLLVAAAGVGLAVVHWRAAHPDLVERLEQLDHAAPAESAGVMERPVPGVDQASVGRTTTDDRPARPARVPKRRAAAGDEPSAPLDLNQATLIDLTRLPGVGSVLAQRILDARDAAQRFGSVDDLLTVRGVGRAKLERLRPFLSVLE